MQESGSASGNCPLDTTQTPIQIGRYADSTYTSTAFSGYMADFYYLEGAAKEETDFGKYNGDGVWVPIDASSSFTSAEYGSNGFHLTFDSSQGIGNDSSGENHDFSYKPTEWWHPC